MTSPQPAEPIDKIIGRNIHKRRQDWDISAADLANAVNISTSQLYEFEAGYTPITVALLVDMARELGVPVGWFLWDGEGNALKIV